MSVRGSVIARGAAVVCAVLAVAGCTSGAEPAPPAPTLVVENDYAFRWVDNPALDLMSPEGTFVRAVTESFSAAYYSQHRYTALDYAYPGFAEIYRRSEKDPDTAFDLNSPYRGVVGTDYYEVIEFSRNGDRRTAVLCRYNDLLSTKYSDGRYTHNPGGPYGLGSVLVFGPDPQVPAAQQKSPPVNQKGAARRPDTDVFGTWILHPETKLTDYIGPQCRKRAPGSDFPILDPAAPNPGRIVDYNRPPVLSPSPGWPDKAAA